MKLKIVSLTHRRYEPVLKFTGKSGKMYPFRWCPKTGRYAFETGKQAEIDDLMEGRELWKDDYFSVVMVSGPIIVESRPPPAPEPTKPEGPKPRRPRKKKSATELRAEREKQLAALEKQ